jgi:predicted DNA binding protein
MDDSILAQVAVAEPPDCPVASLCEDGVVRGVSRAQMPDGHVIVEVTKESTATTSPEPVFEYDAGAVYRVARGPGSDCACEQIEGFGCPVRNVSQPEHELVLEFIVTDLTTLRVIVEQLRDESGTVTLRCLRRSAAPEDGNDLIVLDRGRLTERQRKVLRTAHRMGYFDYPKEANASEVAAALDVSHTTFTEHLGAAQRKLMDALFAKEAAERIDT